MKKIGLWLTLERFSYVEVAAFLVMLKLADENLWWILLWLPLTFAHAYLTLKLRGKI